MHKQVGELIINSSGIATRGLLVRHLILPNYILNSKKVIDFILELSENTYLNIMDQYRPGYKSVNYSDIRRPISAGEYHEIINYARSKGLSRIAD